MSVSQGIFVLAPDNVSYRPWGGQWIAAWKNLPFGDKPIGESWEFSLHPNSPSRLAGAGTEVASIFTATTSFLLKVIDAREALSVQVHPTDAYVRRHKNENGKMESWVILDADEKQGGHLFLGFSEELDSAPQHRRHAFMSAVAQAHALGPSEDPALREQAASLVVPFLNKIRVRAGDVFHVPPGTIHAIGAGVRLCEIQQTSDSTYRVWDWNRLDSAAGPPPQFRPLHWEEAQAVLDWKARPPAAYKRVVQMTEEEGGARRFDLLTGADLPYGLSRYQFKRAEESAVIPFNSFLVVCAYAGEVLLKVEGQASAVRLSRGRTAYIPGGPGFITAQALTPETDLFCARPEGEISSL